MTSNHTQRRLIWKDSEIVLCVFIIASHAHTHSVKEQNRTKKRSIQSPGYHIVFVDHGITTLYGIACGFTSSLYEVTNQAAKIYFYCSCWNRLGLMKGMLESNCGNTMVICHENGFQGCHLGSNLLFPVMLPRTSVFHPVQYSCNVNPAQRSSMASLGTISYHGQWEFALKQEGAGKHAYSREKINVGRAGGHFCTKSSGATGDQ